jgi:hypothetical protein
MQSELQQRAERGVNKEGKGKKEEGREESQIREGAVIGRVPGW